ncbi:MAG: phage holin family protein [Vicinamibacterales bacterium]
MRRWPSAPWCWASSSAVVRPVIALLTLPLTLLTLGLFYFVVNAAAFGTAAALVPGFSVASFWSALFGALVVSLVSPGSSGPSWGGSSRGRDPVCGPTGWQPHSGPPVLS